MLDWGVGDSMSMGHTVVGRVGHIYVICRALSLVADIEERYPKMYVKGDSMKVLLHTWKIQCICTQGQVVPCGIFKGSYVRLVRG
jgi:hypothetical protein